MGGGNGERNLVVAQMVERWTVDPLVRCSIHLDEISK